MAAVGRSRIASMTARPISDEPDVEPASSGGVTARCQTSGGTGRAMRRSRTSASVGACSSAAASARRTRASGAATSRRGQPADPVSRPIATAAGGRSGASDVSIATPGYRVGATFHERHLGRRSSRSRPPDTGSGATFRRARMSGGSSRSPRRALRCARRPGARSGASRRARRRSRAARGDGSPGCIRPRGSGRRRPARAGR